MVEILKALVGHFEGRGINHEGQNFIGAFEANLIGQEKGLSFSFKATGDKGEIFHSESSLIGKNAAGQWALWVLSTNHPGIFERVLKSQDVASDSAQFIFAFGDKNETKSFREEILLEIKKDAVKYVYSWGLPGGNFAERSGCTMVRL